MGDLGDDAHVVRDEHARPRRNFLLQAASDEVEDLGLHSDVERGGRFVGDEQLRIARPSAMAIITR